jgi:hypothetical protein
MRPGVTCLFLVMLTACGTGDGGADIWTELFDTSGDCEIVLDEAACQQAVADRITDQGLCGFPDTNSVAGRTFRCASLPRPASPPGCRAHLQVRLPTSTCIPAWL